MTKYFGPVSIEYGLQIVRYLDKYRYKYDWQITDTPYGSVIEIQVYNY